jgi:DNA-binding transcriptional LysR family regulator
MFPGRLSNIDLRLLHVFRTVVECGGLSAAQIELGISLATISKHLTDLEARLHLRLCMRGRSGFALTEHGQVAHQATLKLFAAVDEFGANIDEAHGRLIGELTVGVIDNTATDPASSLIERVRRFAEVAPEARIKLFVTSPNDIEVGVIDGRINVGIVPVYHRVPGMKYVHLHDEISKLYCGRSHELFDRSESDVTEVDLARQTYVARGYVESMEKNAIVRALTPGATSLHVEGVALLILTGRYIGFLPEHYARQWCLSGQMKPLQPKKMTYSTSICAIVRIGPTRSRLIDVFLGQTPRKRSFSTARKSVSLASLPA